MYELSHKIRIKNTDEFLISKHKDGRKTFWLTTKGKIYSQNLQNLECECVSCRKFFDIKLNHHLLTRERYECYSCQRAGERNNFYGKSHTDISKQKMSESTNHKKENNPYYGKSHTKKVKEKLSKWMTGRFVGKDNHFYGRTHSDESRQKMSEWQSANINIENRRNAGLKSIEVQANGRKTKPEKITEQKLVDMGFDFKYNKIIKNVGQFDFIINNNILLEVNGDYWHANPKFYGEGKREISERQNFKIKRDIEKKAAAEQIGYRVFYIWEDDIKNENYKIIEEIKNELNRF